MFGVVITIFMVCWLPYHVYFIYTYYHPEFTQKSYTGTVPLNSCENFLQIFSDIIDKSKKKHFSKIT
jgi:hypothetical protein